MAARVVNGVAYGSAKVDGAGQRGAGAERLLWRHVQLDARHVRAPQRQRECARAAGAGSHGGVYISHLRGEGKRLLEALE